MHNYKYHILYKTTNIINNKVYVGIHSTDKIEDGYIGSGWILKAAIKKYGKESFKGEVLMILPTRDEARDLEYLLVSGKILNRKDVYNIKEGGGGCEDQCGEKNPMYGKPASNRKRVKATHKDGRELIFESIQECADAIHIDRANVRNLIKKGIVGRRGWKVVKI